MNYLVALTGLALVAAATHLNVLHAGGYYSSEAPLIITVAALLSLGTCFAASCWKDRRYLGAVLLAVCLLSGEVYWLATNAEREIAARELAAAPAVEAQARRETAKVHVGKAEAALAAAQGAVVSEAAKPGCRKECAALLRESVAKAERGLQEARKELGELPGATTAGGLAARLGLPAWAWDLVMACLRSLTVLGGSIAVGLALHPKRGAVVIVEAPLRNAEHEAAHFGLQRLRPDPSASLQLPDLRTAYHEWCAETGIEPLRDEEIAPALALAFGRAGLVLDGKAVSGVALRVT